MGRRRTTSASDLSARVEHHRDEEHNNPIGILDLASAGLDFIRADEKENISIFGNDQVSRTTRSHCFSSAETMRSTCSLSSFLLLLLRTRRIGTDVRYSSVRRASPSPPPPLIDSTGIAFRSVLLFFFCAIFSLSFFFLRFGMSKQQNGSSNNIQLVRLKTGENE